MITTVLLDLDDTIFDFRVAEGVALKKTLTKLKIEPTEQVLAAYSRINREQWKRLELGELTQEEVKVNRYRIFFEQLGIFASAEETAMYYEQNLAMEHQLMEGAVDALKILQKKYRLYAASNGTYEVQLQRIQDSGIAPYFEDVFISKKIGFHKPDARFFAYCFSHIPNFQKEESVMVGDSLSADILGGKNAGLKTIWYRKDKNVIDTKGVGYDACIFNLMELPLALERFCS